MALVASPLLLLEMELGEGSLWDARGQLLYFVDIQKKTVYRFDPATRQLRHWATPTQVSTVVTRTPATGGGLIVALKEDVAHLDLATGKITNLAHAPQNAPQQVRFNDGKCDPAGRLWVGSLDFKDHRAHLFRLTPPLPGGQLEVMLSEVTCSNGLVWTRDHKTMYYIDTPTGRVDAFDYDLAAGTIANRRPAVLVDKALGHPDGMTIDADDHLWVALWGGGKVAHFDPVAGKLVETIEVPGAKNVSSCAFGGPNLQDLYITTASTGMKPEERGQYPAAGHLFHIHLPQTRGVPSPEFAG